jgi:hypothetical protein
MAQPGGQNPSQITLGLTPGLNYQFESDLSMLVPRAYPKFIKQFPSLASKNYIVLREAQNAGLYTANKQFYQWTQKGKNAPAFQVSVTANPGASSGTITCSTAYQFDNNTLSPFGNGLYFRNQTSGQVVQLTNVVNSGGATTATATTTDGSNLLINATDIMTWSATVVGEASGSQTTMATVDVKVTNYCATIKTTQTFTDWSMFERLDIPNNPSGFDRIRFRQQADERDRFLFQQEDLLMFGKPMTNISGVTNNHTGLIPNMQANATTDTVSTIVNQAYFDNIRRNVDAQGYSMNYDCLLNIELRIKWENFMMSTYNAGTLVLANRDAFMGEGAEINRNFKAYELHGIQLNFMTYDYFSIANVFGGQPNSGLYNNACAMIPRGDGVNPEDGTNVPRFQVRWQGVSEGASAIKLRLTGGYAPVPTNDTENLVVSTVATKGLQAFGINGYQWLQLAS